LSEDSFFLSFFLEEKIRNSSIFSAVYLSLGEIIEINEIIRRYIQFTVPFGKRYSSKPNQQKQNKITRHLKRDFCHKKA
jgi:hypothetical protein